jgi:CRISPR/Cas system-associated endonuclease/helicase Cas3
MHDACRESKKIIKNFFHKTLFLQFFFHKKMEKWKNIHRGCLTQLMGGIDTDWASFSEAIERLMTTVRNKDGIESVIKNLDGKLSEAIMHAMTNGPDLEKKVSHVEEVLLLHIRIIPFYSA